MILIQKKYISIRYGAHTVAAGCSDGTIKLYDVRARPSMTAPIIMNNHRGCVTFLFVFPLTTWW